MENAERDTMKKLLIIILISFIGIFIAGCMGEEKESDAKTLSRVINQSDVQGLSLKEFYYLSIPESKSYFFGEGDDSGNGPGIEKYSDALPKGTRLVGQSSSWSGGSGQNVRVLLLKFDSNSKFAAIFTKTLDNYKQHEKELKDKGIEVDDPKIGDNSFYFLNNDSQFDIQIVQLYFTYKNYYVKIEVKNIKHESLMEAIRIAKIVENKLKDND